MILMFFLFLPIAVGLFVFGIKFWRLTIVALLVWLLVEGMFRKWVFPQYQGPILLLKDVGFLAAYCGYMISPKERIGEEDRMRPLRMLSVALGVYCLLELANPSLPTVWLGLYGMKNYLMYIPLAFVIPELWKTREDINKVVLWSCLATIPICLLALYQFTQPPTAWINLYVSHEQGTEVTAVMFGGSGEGAFRYGRARTVSTFSYIGGFATFLIFAVPMVGSRLLVSYKRNREVLIAAAALLLAVGATFTTGSRTPVFVLGAMAPVLVLIAGFKGLLPMGTAFRLVVFVTVAIALSYIFFSDAATAFLYRAENGDDTTTRVLSPIVELMGALTNSPVLGLGVGANSNAAVTLGGADLAWLRGNYVETELARVMQELGLLGFALVYVIKCYVSYVVAKNIAWSRSKLFITVHAAALAFIVPHMVLFTINNPTGGIIYWALIGLSAAMVRIERKERAILEGQAFQAAQMHGPPAGTAPGTAIA